MLKTILIAASLMLIPAAAAAQTQCGPREVVIEHLGKKFQEFTSGIGINNSGGLVELLTSSKGKTWTLIVTTPQGMSCLVSAGEDWQGGFTDVPSSKLEF